MPDSNAYIHYFSEPFTENRILLMHFQYIHSLKIDSSAQSFSEPFTENSFYGCTRKLDRRLRDKMGYILASAFLTFIVSE